MLATQGCAQKIRLETPAGRIPGGKAGRMVPREVLAHWGMRSIKEADWGTSFPFFLTHLPSYLSPFPSVPESTAPESQLWGLSSYFSTSHDVLVRRGLVGLYLSLTPLTHMTDTMHTAPFCQTPQEYHNTTHTTNTHIYHRYNTHILHSIHITYCIYAVPYPIHQAPHYTQIHLIFY